MKIIIGLIVVLVIATVVAAWAYNPDQDNRWAK